MRCRTSYAGNLHRFSHISFHSGFDSRTLRSATKSIDNKGNGQMNHHLTSGYDMTAWME
jgi:hypothetical protein